MFEHLLGLRKHAVILHGALEKRAWLVPTLSVVLHALKLQSLRYGDDPDVLAYAALTADGGASAQAILLPDAGGASFSGLRHGPTEGEKKELHRTG